ncbi:hypothetical protein [uncultured Winogradskyella sp.]|uniref:hypothetical protein n=1 Tax=uncultured Winogradskyella sp. TaxID=395353 RepID=UPI00261E13A2|nr:hypothetical protein [uncultured Winogradskyella sp.]
MIKYATNSFVFFFLVINLSLAQDKLNKENTSKLNQLLEKILDSYKESDESYLLNFDDDYDDSFLIYKFENNFIININEYTFKTTDIKSNKFKETVKILDGEIISYKHINSETGETIQEIPSYKFVIPKQKFEILEKIIVSLLLKNTKTQPKLIFKNAGT